MKTDDLERLQRADHDTLIRMEETIKTIALDIKELKEGTSGRLIDHEARLKKLETALEVSKPEMTLLELRALQGQVRDFTVTANTYRVMGGVMGGLIMFLLTQLPTLIKMFLDLT